MSDVVVVDIETTGLNPGKYCILEVAAVNVTTGEELYFAPALHPDAIKDAQPEALSINRYFERRVYEQELDISSTHAKYRAFAAFLKGKIWAGANPAFDEAFILREHVARSWDRRLLDLVSFAKGRLSLPLEESFSWAEIARDQGVDLGTAHSALDDARAGANLLRRLELVGDRK